MYTILWMGSVKALITASATLADDVPGRSTYVPEELGV